MPSRSLRWEYSKHSACRVQHQLPPLLIQSIALFQIHLIRLPTSKSPTKTRRPGIQIPHPQWPAKAPSGNSHDHCITVSRNSTLCGHSTPAHPTRAVGDANTTRRTGSEFGALIPISTAPSPRSFGPCYTDSGHDLKARMIRPSEPSRRVKVGSVVRWIGAGLLGKLDRVHDSENKQKQR